MKVMVTGGCGFIGKHLVKSLASDYEVLVIDNLSRGDKKYIENIEENVKLFVGDIRNEQTVRKVINDCEFVFHLAAQVIPEISVSNPLEDASTNILGTLNILQNAKNCERIIIFSSAAVYGDAMWLPINEEHPKNPVNMYGVSKLASEMYANVFHKIFGVTIVIFRVFNVYGKYEKIDPYSSVISKFLNNLKTGRELEIFGDGNQTRDFIHVKDIVNASILALEKEKPIGQILNLATGVETSINQLVKIIKEKSEKEVGIKYTRPRKWEPRRSVANISRLKNILGYCPKIKLLEGLTELLK
ncbi:MAG: GDP-mannose 4,6-dehydratase [Candidatus Lokiarchaeia archaeon]